MPNRKFDKLPDSVTELISQYEEMQKNDSQFYFEESSFEHIIEYYEEKQKSNQAIEVVDLAISQYPYSSFFLIKKAQFLFDVKRFDQALEVLNKAEVFDAKDMQIYLLRSDIYVWMEDYKKAVSTISEAIEIADKEEIPDMYLELADIYEEWEKYDEVFESLKKTLIIDHGNEEALNRMWFCTEFTEKYEPSIVFHKRIIDKDPYCYLAWFNLAHAYSGMQLYDKAIDAFEFVLAINENYEYAYKDCGDVLFKVGNYEKATEYYKQAVGLSKPSKELYYCLGECFEHLRKFPKARYYFRKAINIDPNFDEAFYRIGINYKAEEKWNNAVSAFERAYKLNGDNPAYLASLGEVYMQIDEPVKASEVLKKAVELRTNQKDYWIHLANSLFAAEEYREALACLEDAEDYFEEASHLYFIKSAYYYLIGNKNESYLHLESALLQNNEGFQIIFEIAPAMKNDEAIINIIDLYK